MIHPQENQKETEAKRTLHQKKRRSKLQPKGDEAQTSIDINQEVANRD